MPAVSAKCTNSNTAGSTCSSTASNGSQSPTSIQLSNRGGQLKASSSSNCIKTISSYVSNNYNSFSSPSLSLASKQQKPMSKCPHVVLIGDVYAHDLDLNYRRQVQIKKQRLFSQAISKIMPNEELEHEENNKNGTRNENETTSSDENCIENIDGRLKCDECEQERNLWLCLRDTCMFVGCGCGKDEKSNKHSTLHARTYHHPLAMNLTTKAVWCELCNDKIFLEYNYPPFHLKTSNSDVSLADIAVGNNNICNGNENTVDDFDLINFLDEETSRTSKRKLLNSINGNRTSYSSYLFNFDYSSTLNGSNHDDDNEDEDDMNEKNEDSESDSDLNDYFSSGNINSSNLMRKKKKKTKHKFSRYMENGGKLGLDNLGNTCYQNAALQALSNCYPLTSFFLECQTYLHARIVHQAAYLDLNSLSKQSSLPCLANSYMKLMRELWRQPSSNSNNKQKRSLTSFSPNELVQVIRYINPMFRGYMQHDSQEFLIYLMDQLHEELKRPVLLLQANQLQQQSQEQEEEEEEIEQDDDNQEDEDRDDELNNQQDQEENETIRVNGFQNQTSDSIDMLGKDVDSGILSRLSINTNSSTYNHFNSINSTSNINNNNSNHNCNTDDNESVESFETCDSTGISSDKQDLDDEESSNSMNRNSNNKNNNNNTSMSTGSLMSISPEMKRLKLTKRKPAKRQPYNQQIAPARVIYSSIVSDLFEGKLIGQVQCLECMNVSTTTESFLHLSLPIPTKEYLQALHNRVIHNRSHLSNGSNEAANYETVPYQGWLSWMMDLMKGFIWSQTIKLTECLTAFFSDDDLKGDNMYSCEKCKKLTNGVKYSKLLELPETLIIHLKRFRHDSMFSTGKISSYVSFPLDELEMKPFVHKECKNQVTQYDLSSVICHYGGSNGGHYTCYACNYFDEEWYEFDDSYCRKVDLLTVQNIQAYVLFYKKKTNKIDMIKENLRTMIISRTSSSYLVQNSLLKPFYISKQWLQKLKHFSEPGPIDNSDFLCKHNQVRPILWNQIDMLTVLCSADTWFFLVKQFGIRNQENHDEIDPHACNQLYPCSQCQIDDEKMKKRQMFEKNEFLRINEKSRHSMTTPGNRSYAISVTWFKLWESFVQLQHCPQAHQIPGPINNLSICNQQLLKQQKNAPIYQLNKNSNNYKLPEELWHFFLKIYGGGPELLVTGLNGSINSQNGSKPSSPPTKVDETQL